MINKFQTASSIGSPLNISDVIAALFRGGDHTRFANQFKSITNSAHCFFVNSGTTAFYVILKAIRQISEKNEVILPAYTAPSLILPIKKAGLKPVISDISATTFNIDCNALPQIISPNTLAILIVNSFGLPCAIKSIIGFAHQRQIFVIDDAASSLGSHIDGKMTGTGSHIGFFSFNRGKNMSTVSGGAIVTDQKNLARLIEKEVAHLSEMPFLEKCRIVGRAAGLALAAKPTFYGIFKKIIARFKYHELHTDFPVYQYNRFQARLGSRMLHRLPLIISRRSDNGNFLYSQLQHLAHLTLPKIETNAQVIYNQFPLVFKDEKLRDIIFQDLNDQGIEATTLYPRPIHRIDHPSYDLGYDAAHDPFPNATHLSQRLLLLPIHPFINKSHLLKMVAIISAKNHAEGE